VEIHGDMNFNLQGVKLIRKYGKTYPRFLAAGWNFVTRDFAVNMAMKWLAFFTSYFVGAWFEFLYVNRPGVRFLSLVPFLYTQENSVVAITYRRIGYVHVLRPFPARYITRK